MFNISSVDAKNSFARSNKFVAWTQRKVKEISANVDSSWDHGS
jgi:hypothetical protein|tara:strand:- start:303 stop:431 length:129 start_codon:yes stop_codon:yes gene_type:complete